MAAEGLPIQRARPLLGVSVSGYYSWLRRPPSARSIHWAWLTDVISQGHADSRQTYGSKRVHAEMTLARGIEVCRQTVENLMRRAGLRGVSGRPKYRRVPYTATASDLDEGDFTRSEPDRLWATDITERPTREGKVYCAVVLDAFICRIVGWSIDSRPTAALVTNSLGMAIDGRQPAKGEAVIHSDQGTQFTSWAFTRRPIDSGLVPSMGSIGDCFDNAMIESFWSLMQVELLDCQRRRTRIELANTIFEYPEIWHNRQRRYTTHSMLTPIEFKARHQQTTAA
ncbi:MAG: IS3 family transposase [bacterium]|nr:IS3 family transposase [bacterium]